MKHHKLHTNNKTHKCITHVPSSSSTVTPASHPRNNASSQSPVSNNAYRNDEASHANAVRATDWLVCVRKFEESVRLDNDGGGEVIILFGDGVFDVDGDNRNGADVCWGWGEGEERRPRFRRIVLPVLPFILCYYIEVVRSNITFMIHLWECANATIS